MTITEQLAAALRDLLASCIEAYGQPDDGAADESVGWNSAGYTLPFTYGLMQRARAALAAFDAQPAADDDATVERVAARFDHALQVSLVAEALLKGFWFSDEKQAVRAARAALAAMAAPAPADGLAELRVGDFVLRHAANGIWIGRTSGEGGEFATEHVERVIAQFYREQF